MSFRNIIIENPARVYIKNSQLVVFTDKEHIIASEDISSVLLENRQITITTAALTRLSECGCTVFVCDEKHMPCAVLMPYMQHSRQTSVIKNQINMSEPQKKRLWQAMVKAKIQNQARCLKFINKPEEAKFLFDLSKQVKSGDTENIEAAAARYYFPVLFGKDFKRSENNSYNSSLNYGYAILRGFIARNLAAYGFITALGLHHHNFLNSFNLADDLIESFRPVVDLYVYKHIDKDKEFSPDTKRLLFNISNTEILLNGQCQSISYAISLSVQSLLRVLDINSEKLCLPELINLTS